MSPLVSEVHCSYCSLEHELAVESSQPVKDDGITIITLGISSNLDEEQLQAIASSTEQMLIFPDINSPARVDLTSDKLTTLICEGKYNVYKLQMETGHQSACYVGSNFCRWAPNYKGWPFKWAVYFPVIQFIMLPRVGVGELNWNWVRVCDPLWIPLTYFRPNYLNFSNRLQT